MHKRCSSCMGKKEIVGLGNMRKKCTACDGVGYVSVDEPKRAERQKKVD